MSSLAINPLYITATTTKNKKAKKKKKRKQKIQNDKTTKLTIQRRHLEETYES